MMEQQETALTTPVCSRDLLSSMTDGEKIAAARFNETCSDGEGYDVQKNMMERLAELDLVIHKGGGWYEQTDLMLEIENDLWAYAR